MSDMSNAARGIDVRQSGQPLLFDAAPVNSTTGAAITTGTMTAQLSEVQADGSLKAFDFSTNTFVANTGNPATATIALTAQVTGATPYNPGYWSATLATTTGLTAGGIYVITYNVPAGAASTPMRKFQWGQVQGDQFVSAAGAVTATNSHDVLSAVGGPATLKPGDGLKFTVLTQDPTTGQLAAPGSSPTLAIRRDGVLDATPTFTVSNNATGDYKATLAAGSLSGYAAGNLVEVMGTASVTPSGGGSAVSQTRVLLRFVLDALRAGDLPAVILAQPTHPINNDASGNVTATTVVDKLGYGLSGAERTALAGAIGNDVSDTIGADVVALVAALNAVKVVTDKLGVEVESNGVGGFRFTAGALSQSPSGSGGSTVAVDGGTVSAVTSATVFSATGNLNAPSGGYAVLPQQILWITGANKGQRFTIASHGVSGSVHTFTVTGQTVAATVTTDTFFVI
jgi:hypothetical protein